MDLATYRNLVQTLPVPSKAQGEAFSHWVANAHSWYKRIPLLGNGVPFVLYLDPGAGQDRFRRLDGSWEATPRTEKGFHHTAIPTADYLERFGHLAFATGAALQARIVNDDGTFRVETGIAGSVLDKQGGEQPLPAEVEANAVWLTSIINPDTNQQFMWEWIASLDVERYQYYWPEKSGGQETFAKIHARCCELRDDPSRVEKLPIQDDKGRDAVFADLVEPERQRQRRLMVDAIEWLFALVDLPREH